MSSANALTKQSGIWFSEKAREGKNKKLKVFLEPLFKQWRKYIERASARWKKHDSCALWENEETHVSILAAAAWHQEMIALVEMPITRSDKRKSDRRKTQDAFVDIYIEDTEEN